MKLINWFLSITFCFFLINCKPETKSQAIDPSQKLTINENKNIVYNKSSIVEFDIDPLAFSSISFNDVFEVEKIIYLEDKIVVGDVKKLMVFDNKFYIQDKITDKFHCFDQDGKHLWTFQQKGEGPTDYISLSGFDFNKNDLCLWDANGLKVLILDPSNGKFKSSQKLNSFGQDFIFIDENYVLYPLGFYNEEQAFKLLFVNQKNELVGKALPFESQDYFNSSLPSKVFSKDEFNQSFYFTQRFNDTVFFYKKDTVFAKYKINYGNNKKIDYSKFQNDDEIAKYLLEHKIFDGSMDEIVILKDHLLFQYSNFNENYGVFVIHFGILNQSTHEVKVFKKFLENPFEWTKPHALSIKYVNQNYAYIVIDPNIYNDIRKAWDLKENGVSVATHAAKNYPIIHEIISNTNEFSNPILVKLKIKL